MLRRRRSIAAVIVVAALPLLTGCSQTGADPDRGATASAAALGSQEPLAVPAGVQMAVRLSGSLSSENAKVGDPWSGTVVTAVTIGSQEVIPANSTVRGVVTGVQPAARGTRAMLDLTIQDVAIDSTPRPLTAGIEAILAELPDAPGGSSPASAITPAQRGSEVVLASGSELVFSVQEPVPIR